MINQYQKTVSIATFLFFVLVFLAGNAFTEELPETESSEAETTQDETLPVLPQVTVTGVRIAPMTGATILDRELIETLPARNGTINELISIVPGIQYSETSTHSFTGGEITPPNLSISGSRYYQNNYTIDGFSNNSALEPANTNIFSISILPGHPQQIFLDPRLVEQITVYDSNIPAKYGGFTGGMVAAETLDPVDEFWGQLNYRTTRDNWTKFHIHPDDQPDFDNSQTEAKQPKFTKHDGGFILNSPIGTDMGILTSYQRIQSDIPLTHFGNTKDQTRRSENFFAKYGYHITNDNRLYLTGILAPYKNEYFQPNKNSDYTIEGDVITTSAKYEHDLTIGTLNLDFGYSYQETERQATSVRYKWDTSTPSIDWDKGVEGSSGPLDTSQEDFEFKTAFALQEFSTAGIFHQVELGADAEHSKQTYERPETAYYYTDSSLSPAVIDPTIECNGAVACIDNEQYLLQRYVYLEGASEASYNQYSAFLQDAMSWKRLEVFPGVRVSHDDYTENTNVAPRFSTALDIFGNRKTILFGGASRYYSGNLLTYKLRDAISASGLYETRTDLDADFITTSDGIYLYAGSDLKTPYSDEINIGLIQALFGGELKVEYIERTGKDELAQERSDTQPDGYRYNSLNNNGRSEHESYQFTWQRSWRNHYLELNGSYQETTTSNLKYNNTVDADDVEELIWYNGKILSYEEIPRTDFNRPTIINLIYSGKLPFNTHFTNTTKYRNKYYRLKYLPGVDPTGEGIRAYEKDKNKSSIVFDWRFAWGIPVDPAWETLLTLDIYNVFDEKARVSRYDDQYELGRQLWAGVEINF